MLVRPSFDINIPSPKLQCLWDDQYTEVALYGGRAGLKSYGATDLLILDSFKGKEGYHIGCFRAIQKSMDTSTMPLLKLRIKALGLENYFEVQKTCIINKYSGVKFVFVGLNINHLSVKGFERLYRVWIEEADMVSQGAIDSVIDTCLRVEGLKMVYTFNPKFVTDPVYKRFVVGPRPDNCAVQYIDYRDNPFVTKAQFERIEWLKAHDFQSYEHLYLGKPLEVGDDLLLSFTQITNAVGREERKDDNAPILASLDVGSRHDPSILTFKQGRVVFDPKEYRIPDLSQLEMIAFRECIDNKVSALVVDATGIGLGVHDHLKVMLASHNIPVVEYHGAGKSPEDRYKNKRAYCHWKLRDAIINGGLSLPNCRDLIDELAMLKYIPDPLSGKFTMKPKEDLIAEYGHSPNYSDSVMMLFDEELEKVSVKKGFSGNLSTFGIKRPRI